MISTINSKQCNKNILLTNPFSINLKERDEGKLRLELEDVIITARMNNIRMSDIWMRSVGTVVHFILNRNV